MKKWKIWQIILFVTLCICLNVGGKLISVWLEWPIWGDAVGTALCAYVAGPICGAMVGLTGNLAYFMVNNLSAWYSLTSIAIGILIGLAARYKWFDHFYGFMKAASLAMISALVVSVPLNIMLTDGYTGNKWGDGVVGYLLAQKFPPFVCTVLGQLAIEFVDKILTISAVYIVIIIQRIRSSSEEVEKARKGNAAGVALFLCFVMGAGLVSPLRAGADQLYETQDYTDYVQTVYSSNNGLPCGEANDIEQTHDGVLWIGTYAGLYRYNGREFRWVDDFESVKNVNCLYVDEEGRLWIGTNDNGLSIVIREKVVNVLDQENGLPSNSVRCITRAADGYYYVGTTGSLQILVMNNGLEAVKTLQDVNDADSISADDAGRVAAIASDGRL